MAMLPTTPKRSGSAATIIIAILAVGAFAAVFKPAVRQNVFPKNFGVVEEGRLYRSGQFSPAAFRKIHEQHRFRTVIDLGSYEEGSRGDRRNQLLADSVGIPRYRFDLIGDATGNPNAYAQVLRIIKDPANQPVLVHCGAGSERTSCTVIMYDHIRRGQSFETGLALSEYYKHNPRRNPKLREVVEQYGESIIDAYRSGGAIPGVDPLPAPRPVSASSR